MRSLKLALLLIAIGVIVNPLQSSVLSQSKEKPNQPGSNPLMLGCSVADPIDECIQAMFSKADIRFGMARVPTRRSHITYFIQSTAKEVSAVKELEDAGWEMGFYLAGRSILGEKPVSTAYFQYGHKHPVIGGPVAITGSSNYKAVEIVRGAMPDPSELWDEGQKAMRAFDTSDRYEFSVGKWKVEARPIRARENCLKCHNNNQNSDGLIDMNQALSKTPIKVGDALGVAMYAYTKK